jgi:RecJ-like exonuclease
MKKFFVLAVVLSLMCSCDALVDQVTCSKCGGSGKCQNCDGTGKVLYVFKCGECNGSGKCQSCNGRGYTIHLDDVPDAKDNRLQMEFCGILLQPNDVDVGRR